MIQMLNLKTMHFALEEKMNLWNSSYTFLLGKNAHLTTDQIHSSTTQHQNHNRIKKKNKSISLIKKNHRVKIKIETRAFRISPNLNWNIYPNPDYPNRIMIQPLTPVPDPPFFAVGWPEPQPPSVNPHSSHS
jgi:hypothetical protein